MTPTRPMRPTRRDLLALAGGLPLAAGGLARAAEPSVRVGILPFGTVTWEADTIRREGLDVARGFRLEPVKLASNEAARIAFQSGVVDTVVSDLLLAARLRAEGRGIKFLPFSTTEGAVMVAAGSPIAGVGDLKGKRLGVAGGPLDKSWLLLQAYARERGGLDLAKEASPAYGASPLIAQKLEAGELDAALLYWNFCARLEAKGYRRLLDAGEMARAFGVKGEIALLGYLFTESFVERRADLEAFAAASREAKRVLASSADAWGALRPLMQADDEATFQSLKRYFIEGIPRRPIAEERADAERLFAVLARLGGERLVGPATQLPDGLYVEAAGNG